MEQQQGRPTPPMPPENYLSSPTGFAVDHVGDDGDFIVGLQTASSNRAFTRELGICSIAIKLATHIALYVVLSDVNSNVSAFFRSAFLHPL